MAAADPTTHEAIIKRLYPWNEVQKKMQENNPCYAQMPKNYEGYGESWSMPVRIAHTAGRSRTFATAKANKAGTVNKVFRPTVTRDYSLYSVDGLLAAQTANSKGAFVEAFEHELDGALDAMARNAGISIFRNHGGAIARLSASQTLTATTFTPATPDDILNFEVGDCLEFAITDGTTGTVKTGQAVVTAVVYDDGAELVTVAAPLNSTVLSIAVSDYVFHAGDFGQAWRGLPSWLPTTAPTGGDSFFNVDRSVSPTRLAGVRVSGTGLAIEEALQKLLHQGWRFGARMDKIYVSDKKFYELVLSLGSRVTYVDVKTEVGVGFTGVRIIGPNGAVSVFSDPNCPVTVGYGLTMKDWAIMGPGKFPYIDAKDGTKILREDAADAYEGRIKNYSQPICKNPGNSGVVTLDA